MNACKRWSSNKLATSLLVLTIGFLLPWAASADPLPELSTSTDAQGPDGVSNTNAAGRAGRLDPFAELSGQVPESFLSSATDSHPAFDEPLCDVTVTSVGSEVRRRRLKLQKYRVGLPLAPNQDYHFEHLDGSSNHAPVLGKSVVRFEYYEDRMLSHAASLLDGVSKEQLGTRGAKFDITPAARPGLAIAILKKAISEHDSAVTLGRRAGSSWGNLRDQLLHGVFNLYRNMTETCCAERNVKGAVALYDRLRVFVEEQGRSQELRRPLILLYVKVVQDPIRVAIDAKDYSTANALLSGFTQRFPHEDSGFLLEEGEIINDIKILYEYHRKIVETARALAKRAMEETDFRTRLQKLDEAEQVWPDLRSELQSVRHGIYQDYPTLECAYRRLPRTLSPFDVELDVERHAVYLIYESLMRWDRDPTLPRFQTQLAAGFPLLQDQGRSYRLRRDVVWSSDGSDSSRLTYRDVRLTHRLLKSRIRELQNGQGPNIWPKEYEPAYHWISEVRRKTDHVVDFDFYFDPWLPLSMAEFPIIPAQRFPNGGTDREWDDFKRSPMGTGPFRLGEWHHDRLLLSANPSYRHRDAVGIREIAFHQRIPDAAVDDFLRREIDIIYDLPRELVNQLVALGKRVEKLEVPRVFFLAPNYKQSRLLKNTRIRRAISYAIDRRSILDEYYQAQGRPADHHVLGGIFPANSWAQAPQVPPRVTEQRIHERNLVMAVENFRRGITEIDPLRPVNRGASMKLRLGFPEEHEAVANEIAKQIETAFETAQDLTVRVELQMVTDEMHNLWRSGQIELSAIDLMLCSYLFTNEFYSIRPLLLPDDGFYLADFMQPLPAKIWRRVADYSELLRKHNSFAAIQRATQSLDRFIGDEAVVIPLWQLDVYVAVSDAVKGYSPHPLRLFDRIEQWTVDRRNQTALK